MRSTKNKEEEISDRTFEWRLVGKFAGIVLAGLGGTVLSLYLALPKGEATSFGEVIRSLVTADNALSRAIVVALVAEAVVISVAVALTTVLTSHKIAGPVYRLKVALDELALAQGARPIRLRKNDQLRKSAESFNTMQAGLQERFRSLGNACEDVAEAALRQVESPGGRGRGKAEIDRRGHAPGGFTL